MECKPFSENWVYRDKNKQAATELWDAMAPHFGSFTLPSADDSAFMALLKQENMVPKDGEVLDVGCGAGRFALALAPECRHVTGIDLSEKMIGLAKEKADEHQVENVDFLVADWQGFDLQAAGMEKRYDLVFAHMSPAIQSAETFWMLTEASKNWCVMVKPVRRSDRIAKEIKKILGFENMGDGGAEDILYAFNLLWCNGYLPFLAYEKRHHQSVRGLDEAIEIHVKRIKASRDLTPAEEEKISTYLRSIAEDGQIKEEVDTLNATIYWQVTKGEE